VFERYGEAVRGMEEVEKRAVKEAGHGMEKEENVAQELDV
jgi:hypothetical protein